MSHILNELRAILNLSLLLLSLNLCKVLNLSCVKNNSIHPFRFGERDRII